MIVGVWIHPRKENLAQRACWWGLSVGAELVTSDGNLVGSSMERECGTESSLVGSFEGEELAIPIEGLPHIHCST